MKINSIIKKTFAASAALAGLATLGGCAVMKNAGDSATKYWHEETRTYQTVKEYPDTVHNSNDPKDYILENGLGIAIPTKERADLYISPFAPEAGYVVSKEPPKSLVECPYSKRILILGEREVVKEKELQH